MVSANGGNLSDIPKLNISTKWKKILSSVNPNQFQFKKNHIRVKLVTDLGLVNPSKKFRVFEFSVNSSSLS